MVSTLCRATLHLPTLKTNIAFVGKNGHLQNDIDLASSGFERHESRNTKPQLNPVVFHVWSRRVRFALDDSVQASETMFECCFTIPVVFVTDLAQYRPYSFKVKSSLSSTLSTIVHSLCFCCMSEQKCRTNFLVFVDLKRCSGFREPSSSFLHSDQAEQFRRCFPQCAVRACQSVSVVTSD